MAKKSRKVSKAAKSRPSAAQIAARKAGAARFKALAKGRGKIKSKSVASKPAVRAKRRKTRKKVAAYSGPLSIPEVQAAEEVAGKYAAVGGFSPAGGVSAGAGAFFDPVSPTHGGSQMYQAAKVSAPYFNYKGQLRKPVGWFEPGLPGVHNKTEWQLQGKKVSGKASKRAASGSMKKYFIGIGANPSRLDSAGNFLPGRGRTVSKRPGTMTQLSPLW